MVTTASIARVAALIGDPTRASMLQALMEGRALTAAELAGVARVAPQTASGHLAQLTTAGLVTVARQGRHRYHRLATPLVARQVPVAALTTEAVRIGVWDVIARRPKNVEALQEVGTLRLPGSVVHGSVGWC